MAEQPLFTSEQMENNQWQSSVARAVEILRSEGVTNPTEEQITSRFNLGGNYWVARGIRSALLYPGQILSEAGKPGKLETESYERRSKIEPTGQPSQYSQQYTDKDSGVTVYAPAGEYFEIYENGATRRKTGTPPRMDDPTLAAIQPDPDGRNGGTAGSGSSAQPSYAYRNSEAYKSLSQEDKDFIDIAYGSFAAENSQQMELLTRAIDQAIKLADPFSKAQLSLAKLAIVDKIAETTNDYSFKEEQTKRIRDELFEDIALSSESLTLEEQAQLAEIGREFDQQILSARDKAAETGTTFNTGRASLEESEALLQARTAGTIESLNRRTTFGLKQLELKAERGDSQAQAELDQLKFKRGLDIRALTRSAESTLGTKEASKLGGIDLGQLVGGVEGEIESERKQSIREKIAQFFSLGQGEV